MSLPTLDNKSPQGVFDQLDAAVAGILVHNMTADSDYLLSPATDPQEWAYGIIKITDTGVLLTTGRNVITAVASKVYIFANATAQTLTLKTFAGAGVAVAAGTNVIVFCDGTDVLAIT